MVFLLTLSLFTACGKPETEEVPEGVIRIGVLEPLSGSESTGAKEELRGIELAYELCAVAGDYTIELVKVDNESNLKQTEKAAETIVAKGCIAALGSYGNMLTLAASDTLQEAKIPLVNVTGTNPLLTGSSPYLFRTATVETEQADCAAEYLTKELGLEKLAILIPDGSDYAETMAEEFENALGSEIARVTYLAGETDFTTQLKVLRSTGCEAVYLLGNATDMAEFLTEAKANGKKWKYFGTQALKTDEMLSLAGQAAEGLYTTGDWDPLVAYTERSTRFLNAYRSRYGEEAIPTEAEALGYEAYMLIVNAINRAIADNPGVVITGEMVRDALVTTENFEGVTGVASMDTDGDLSREQTVWMVAEGAFVNTKTNTPPEEEKEIFLDPSLYLDSLDTEETDVVFLELESGSSGSEKKDK